MNNTIKRVHSVLLLADEPASHRGLSVLGPSHWSSPRANYCDVVEILSAFNRSFHVMPSRDLTRDAVIEEDLILFSTIIILSTLKNFTESQKKLIKELSEDNGVSIVSFYNNVNEETRKLFGILGRGRKRFLFPQRVKVLNNEKEKEHYYQTVNCGPFSGSSGIRKGGFGKIPARYILRKIRNFSTKLLIPFFHYQLKTEAVEIKATSSWGAPLFWSHRIGRANNYFFTLRTGDFLSGYNGLHHLLLRAVDENSGAGFSWIDTSNTVVLRMDDPGACIKAYRSSMEIMKSEDWKELGQLAKKRNWPISVMYTPGWVDDGDTVKGTLFIDGKEQAHRKCGTIYDSWKVRYDESNPNGRSLDYSVEFSEIKKLCREGIVDLQSHGLTHLCPDHDKWCFSENRLSDDAWHHEFYDVVNGLPCPEESQKFSLSESKARIEDQMGRSPSVITPSGHIHDDRTDQLAGEAGYSLFSADYLGVIKRGCLIRNWKTPSIFLYFKTPSDEMLESGFPFIGIFHDYEVKRPGLVKLDAIVQDLAKNGMKRFVTFRELTTLMCTDVRAVFDEDEKEIRIDLQFPERGQRKKAGTLDVTVSVPLNVRVPKGLEPKIGSWALSRARVSKHHFEGAKGLFSLDITASDDVDRISMVVPLQAVAGNNHNES